MPQKKVLFNEVSDEEEETFKINKDYATKYEEWRRGEELQKLKDRYGEDGILSSDSETSSDDEFVEPDNPEFDNDFLVTMGALHKKSEAVLERNDFFCGNYTKKKEKEEKPFTVRDFERHFIMDYGGELDDNNDLLMKDYGDKPEDEETVTFKDDKESSDDDGDGLLSSGLFTVKENTQKNKKEQTTKDVGDAVAFVRGESSAVSNPKDKNLLEGLRDAWRDPKLSKNDKWLADFFLNKRYLEDDDEAIERAYNETVIDEETLSEDEKTLEKMDTFETKYRFRYEEPDDEFIKKYPRIIPESLRASDKRKQLKHKALKQRKQEEKELKRQEIRKLKALKYKEIEAKIQKIKEASGNMDIDLGDKELNKDFDPATHDQAMSRMFGDEYYEVEDGNTEKPVFSDDEDIIKDYDDWMEKQGPNHAGGANDGGEDEYEGSDWEEVEDFNMDADHDPNEAKEALQQEMIKASSRKKCRRKSKFAKALAKKKPVFDPKEKNFESYYDEYYQLDFEDVVGGIPCRFKYRKVECNNFGLSTEEILTAQDKELNRWYSLKKLLQYNRTPSEERRDHCRCTHRASHLHVKQKILPSLFVNNPEELHIREEEKKREKNLKKKLRRQDNAKRSGSTSTVEDTNALCAKSKLEVSNKEPPYMNKEPLINKLRDEREDSLHNGENKKSSELNVLANETSDSNNIKLSEDESEEWLKKERDPGYETTNGSNKIKLSQDNGENKKSSKLNVLANETSDSNNIKLSEDESEEWLKKERDPGYETTNGSNKIKLSQDESEEGPKKNEKHPGYDNLDIVENRMIETLDSNVEHSILPKKRKAKAVGQDKLDSIKDRNSTGSNEGDCSLSKKRKVNLKKKVTKNKKEEKISIKDRNSTGSNEGDCSLSKKRKVNLKKKKKVNKKEEKIPPKRLNMKKPNKIKLSQGESKEGPKKNEKHPGYDNLDIVENRMIETLDSNVEHSILPKKRKAKAVGQDKLDSIKDRNSTGSNEGDCSLSKKRKVNLKKKVNKNKKEEKISIKDRNSTGSNEGDCSLSKKRKVNLKKKVNKNKKEEKIPPKRLNMKKPNKIKLSQDESKEGPKKKEKHPGYDNLDIVENRMIETLDSNVEHSILPKKRKAKAVGQDKLDSIKDRNSTGSNEGDCSLSKKRKVNLKKKKKVNKKKNKKEEKIPPKRLNMKKPANHLDIPFFKGISNARLVAYGEHPMNLKRKLKYGKQKL
ncbi:uncharacterized protein [Panulirus ornatus]|uniref:uncharacterized protein n=1 Tax=Panulirus ornatus TaxID=150431 RepID=UPI003A8839EF